MSFSRSKIKRFNEIQSCAPPVGTYDPRMGQSSLSFSIHKSERFKDSKMDDHSISYYKSDSEITKFIPPKINIQSHRTPKNVKRKLLGIKNNEKSLCMDQGSKPQKNIYEISLQQYKANYELQLKEAINKHQQTLSQLKLTTLSYENLQKENKCFQENLDSNKEHYSKLIDTLTGENNDYKQKLSELTLDQQKLRDHITHLKHESKKSLDDLKLEIEQKSDEIKVLQHQIGEIKQQYNSCKKNLDHILIKSQDKDAEYGIEINDMKLKLQNAETKFKIAMEQKDLSISQAIEKFRSLNDIINIYMTEFHKIIKVVNLLKLDTCNMKSKFRQVTQEFTLMTNEMYSNIKMVNSQLTELNTSYIYMTNLQEKEKRQYEFKIGKLMQVSNNLKKELENYQAEFTSINNKHEMEKKNLVETQNNVQDELLTKIDELNELLQEKDRLMEQSEARMQDMEEKFQSEVEAQLDDNIARLEQMYLKENADYKQKFEKKEADYEEIKAKLVISEVQRKELGKACDHYRDEYEKLEKEYADMMGHNNHRQKIRHVVTLKEENLKLSEGLAKSQNECKKKGELLRLAEEKINRLEGKRKFDPALAFKFNKTSSTVMKDMNGKENRQ